MTFDDTLPPAEEVEREFRERAGDNAAAIKWLVDHGIDAVPPPQAALIQYGIVWTPEIGQYRCVIYQPEHIGPKHPPELAVPIFENGTFIDLLVISGEKHFASVTCRASWLGRENLALPVVRLHAHPLDWLADGCTGVCHIALISRKALKELAAAGTIECNKIETALEAWDWGFGADEAELARFEVDDTREAIEAYYERQVCWHSELVAAKMRRECWC
ncbi:hypothetical protein QA633_40050 [Bradyrhizobium barranii]|uniref:hypothetical protein n=1 Tax=Bradyrhizobium barranii TaxID=2992140 RepID=UPI0024AEFA5D|nr:hypothetical protein [Bradyrhizobium barranii]WFT94384.1 hypothetical protein QA633_40050 [Bradyrhizobium barranii]